MLVTHKKSVNFNPTKEGYLIPYLALTGNFSEPLMQVLHRQFTSHLTTQKPHLSIYISRAKAPTRKVVNDEEVVTLLKKPGFQTYYFETLTWKQQLSLNYQTKYLVGVHDAGLTNMRFMQPNTCVLELRRVQDQHNNCYFSLASALNIHYYYQCCATDHEDTTTANYQVNIQLLEKNIKQMLQND
ncbi:MAG: glycosyltransferase family 61 protein [Bacteroidota bacterium]